MICSINNNFYEIPKNLEKETTPIPTRPEFIRKDEKKWNGIGAFLQEKCINHQKKYSGHFYRGQCRTSCENLYLLLAMAFGKRVTDQNTLVLSLNDQESILMPCHYMEGCDEHYYFVLSIDNEQWIIDPTWKQFAGAVDKDWSYSMETRYNQRLQNEFPDLLVIQKDQMKSLFRSLARESNSFSRIEDKTYYWENELCGERSEIARKKFYRLLSSAADGPVGIEEKCKIEQWEVNWNQFAQITETNEISLKKFCNNFLNRKV